MGCWNLGVRRSTMPIVPLSSAATKPHLALPTLWWYRCASLPPAHPPAQQNFVSKWISADWVEAAAGGYESPQAFAAAHPTAGGWPRVHCRWHQTATATGRLSSSAPNLQAGQNAGGAPAGCRRLVWMLHSDLALTCELLCFLPLCLSFRRP